MTRVIGAAMIAALCLTEPAVADARTKATSRHAAKKAAAANPGKAAGAKPGHTFGAKATAYSVKGKTADGTKTRTGVVAADPDVLPLGSRVRLKGAGEKSGEYVVEDTGRAVQGKKIDIFVPSEHEAKHFGERDVQVEVLERGEGRDGIPEPAPGPTGK